MLTLAIIHLDTMESISINNIDLTVVIVYFLFIFVLGLWIARSNKSSEDLFLGGRTFTWGLIGLSIFASNISSSTIIGLSGAAYSSGIVQSVYEWMAGIALLIAAGIFIPMYLRSKITTIPEFLELRYDSRSRTFFSVITIFMSVIIEMAGGLYAGSLVLQVFFPSLELWQTAFILAAFAGVYTAFGGLKAVVYTDAIQAVVLLVGCAILSYLLFQEMDFSWQNIVDSVPAEHLSVVRPLDDKTLPWLGLLIGVPFLQFWYFSTNQYIIQRALGGKDVNHARWGLVLASLLKIAPLFLMVIPGVMAISVIPGLDNPDMVFPTAMKEFLPVGLMGLVLAGLISAIMSSVDSILNSSSTLIIMDFVKPRNPDMDDKKLLIIARYLTLGLALLAALWAPQISNFTGLWDYLQQMFSIVVPPIAVIFLVGVFFKRGNGDGAYWTLILGTVFGILLFILGLMDLWKIHYTINVGIAVLVSSIVFYVVSLRSPAPSSEVIDQFTYKPALFTEGMEGYPWYKDYRYQSVAVLALILIILIIFW